MSSKKDSSASGESSSKYVIEWSPSKEMEKHTGLNNRYPGMSYDEIKAALTPGEMFVDDDFDAVDSNVFYSGMKADLPNQAPYIWKRPKELSKNPLFFAEGATRFDVCQGVVGDCWFLCTLASLSLHPNLLRKVVPEQNFKEGYAGIFRFSFWHDGKWVEVVIDDRLPINSKEELFLLHSSDKNEFWSALLEKAYAKLYGAYECLNLGLPSEAMVDFTGGIVERFPLGDDTPKNLVKILVQAFERGSLAAIFTLPAEGSSKEVVDPKTRIVKGHAYSITDIKTIDHDKSKVTLFRIRNPWGQIEWQGDWSDKSSIWKTVPADLRKKLGIVNNELDGEFWIAYNDLIQYFIVIELCHLVSKLKESDKSWHKIKHYGSWKVNVNAGGSPKHADTYWTNPQYRFKVVDSDEDDDVKTGTVLVALTQCGAREKRRYMAEARAIGYAIYKLDDSHNYGNRQLPQSFFDSHPMVGHSGSSLSVHDEMYLPFQHICTRHELAPGDYVVIPSTSEPGQEMKFLLRLFTEQPIIISQ